MAQHRFPDLKIKASGENGLIEGYCAVFNNRDLANDICLPGCFANSLESHKAAGTMPAMLFSHDQARPIGRWNEIFEDDYGLFGKGRLTLDIQPAKDAFALATDGCLSLSIGFATVQAHYDQNRQANLLEAVDLREVSMVAMPANSQAKITSVKTLATVRDYERALRSDYGLSQRQAKKLIQGGWKAFQPGSEVEQKQLADLIRGSANKFKR